MSESGAFGCVCPICQTPNHKTINYCVKCGHRLLNTIDKDKPMSKNEFKKYFSGQKGNSKKGRITSWSLLVFFIGFYILGSADVKIILSILIGIAGLLSIIKPLAFLGIGSRRKGLGTFLFGLVVLFVSAAFLPPANFTFTNQEPINIDEFKANSILIPYEDLARKTEKYVGKKTKFNGQVIQVKEIYDNEIVLRVNVTKGEYGIYRDTIWINYKYEEGESRILEDDIINVWGEIKGRKSYLTVLGAKITIPELDGVVIEIIGKVN
ncbi:MAG: hypothetical protein KGZ57_02685 [Dethiobacter sp.]|nr:hypothetical protein [Dethiobacter sp.]